MSERRQRTRALVAGLLMGAGLGGFFDGIVFHQILQWHNMLSGWIPPDDLVSVKVNMVWDGYFHLAVWLITIAGLAVLLQAVARTPGPFPSRYVVGALLAGWGIFNLAEGIIDHHVLGVHRVHPASDMAMAWDIGFLASGIVLIVVGALIARRSPSSSGRSTGV